MRSLIEDHHMNPPESNEMVQQGAVAGPAFASPLAPRAYGRWKRRRGNGVGYATPLGYN
jgi:hypothetical protein